MRKTLFIRSLILITCLAASGCALSGGSEKNCRIYSKVEFSKDYVQFLKHLGADRQYTDEFKQIEIVAGQIRLNLEADEIAGACRAADICLALCRHLTNRYYREFLSPAAQRLEKEISELGGFDSMALPKQQTSALENIKQEPAIHPHQDAFSAVSRVIDDIDTVLETSSDLRSAFTETLSVDELFTRQSCELSENGRRIIRDLISKAVSIASETPFEFVEIRFKVIGYTDQLDFGKESPLLKTVLNQIDDRPPESGPERRRFLNRRLSKMRARAVAEYIDFAGLRIKTGKAGRFTLITEAVGRGEDPPPDVRPPYPIPDQRRRICRIHVFCARR